MRCLVQDEAQALQKRDRARHTLGVRPFVDLACRRHEEARKEEPGGRERVRRRCGPARRGTHRPARSTRSLSRRKSCRQIAVGSAWCSRNVQTERAPDDGRLGREPGVEEPVEQPGDEIRKEESSERGEAGEGGRLQRRPGPGEERQPRERKEEDTRDLDATETLRGARERVCIPMLDDSPHANHRIRGTCASTPRLRR